MHSLLAHCSNHNNTRRSNYSAFTLLAFDNHSSAFVEFSHNGGSCMLTCALYYCSIVVNTDGNGLCLTRHFLDHRTGDDIGVLLIRIWTGSNDFYITPML